MNPVFVPLTELARQTPNRGRVHLFLGDPLSDGWACAGLRKAARAALMIAEPGAAAAWSLLADQVEERMRSVLLADCGNDRDPVVTPYPTGVLTGDKRLRSRFAGWYRARRLDPDGTRRTEPLWTYFEAAQIHNAMLPGLTREAWVNLDGMLADGGDASVYGEGKPGGGEMLPFRNGDGLRGWLNRQTAAWGNMPHNWTNAEMVNLIRDLFVREEAEGIVLGSGVPSPWLAPGSSFGVRNMPTTQGVVSYEVRIGAGGKPEVKYDGPAPYRLGFGRDGRFCVP